MQLSRTNSSKPSENPNPKTKGRSHSSKINFFKKNTKFNELQSNLDKMNRDKDPQIRKLEEESSEQVRRILSLQDKVLDQNAELLQTKNELQELLERDDL